MLQIGQKDPESLERFRVAVQGQTRVYGPYGKVGMYNVRINGTLEVTRVLGLLWPWLGRLKRQQAQEHGLLVCGGETV